MVKSLQSLRFAFALLIFLHHSAFPITALGAFPVAFFLILSGFVLMKANRDGFEEQGQIIPFFINRVRKIYPVHILCLILALVVCLVVKINVDWVSVIPNVFMLHSWIPKERFYFSGNSVSWYLCVIVFCYAMFPLLSKWIKRWGGQFVILLLFVYVCAFIFVPDDKVHDLIYVNPLFRIVDFCLGIYLYHICSNGFLDLFTQKLILFDRKKKTLIEFSLILFVLILIAASQVVSKRYSYACFWWLPSLLIIYLFYIYDNKGGVVSSIMNNKLFVFLGSLSFVFYMLHIQILILNNYLMTNVISMNYYLNGVVVLLATIGLSYVVTYYYMPLFSNHKNKKI